MPFLYLMIDVILSSVAFLLKQLLKGAKPLRRSAMRIRAMA